MQRELSIRSGGFGLGLCIAVSACCPSPLAFEGSAPSAPVGAETRDGQPVDAEEPKQMNPSSVIAASDARIVVIGRAERVPGGALRFGYPGVTLRLRVNAPELRVRISSTSSDSALGLFVDGQKRSTLRWGGKDEWVSLYDGANGMHDVELVHLTETWRGVVTLSGFELPRGGRFEAPLASSRRRLLFIGDSVTCGEAVERTPGCQKDASWWNAAESYGMLTARALGAEAELVCFGGRGLIRDWQGRTEPLTAPRFFELTVPDSEDSPRWPHTQHPADAIVVSLGTNDFNLALGPLPERESYVAAYVAFLRRLREVHPSAMIVLTDGAMVNDQTDPARPQKRVLGAYLEEVRQRAADDAVRVMIAEHHPGDACDAHPTKEQHRAMAAELQAVFAQLLGW